MKAGIAKVSYPGHAQVSTTPGALNEQPKELEPIGDVEDIRQHPEYEYDVPVCVKGIANVRILPAKRASHETVFPPTLAAIQAVNGPQLPILQPKDPRVKSFILSVAAQNVYLGTREQLMQGTPTGFLVVAGNQLPPFEGCDDDLYVLGVAAGASVSIRRQYWAD